MSAPLDALDALLRPAAVAVVGASARAGSFGQILLDGLRESGFPGRLYPVNPGYATIGDLPCFPSVDAIPEAVDCALLAVGNDRLEGALTDTAAAGSRAAMIFGSAQGTTTGGRPLGDRLAEIAREAGMALCGGNSMGALNLRDRWHATGYPYRGDPTPGRVAFISHSGSTFSAFVNNRRGLRFSHLISCGQELVTTAADYLRWTLDQPETRVVGCFLEAIRDPARFKTALLLAAERGIPVVVLKVGRSEQARAYVAAHSGAVTGEDAIVDAVLFSTGAIRVRSLDEMLDTLELLATAPLPSGGGLALATDSGGERALIVDTVEEIGTDWVKLAPATLERLREALDPELEPSNPIDLWGSGRDFEESFIRCLLALGDDPGVGMVVFAVDLIPRSRLLPAYVTIAERVATRIATPFAVLSNVAATADDEAAARLRAAGIPVLLGTANGLAAIRHALAYAERRPDSGHEAQPERQLDPAQRHWLERLRGSDGRPLDEIESKRLLAAWGISVVPEAVVTSPDEAIEATERFGLPVVLKTAMPGITHKAQAGGVMLGIRTETDLREAYSELARKLGPRAVIQPEIARQGALEVFLGMVNDRDWGPVITVGLGGTHVETLRETVSLLPELGDRGLRERLRSVRLLAVAEQMSGADPDRLLEIVRRFGRLVADLARVIQAIDVNPLIVGPGGVVAVDGLVVPRGATRPEEPAGG